MDIAGEPIQQHTVRTALVAVDKGTAFQKLLKHGNSPRTCLAEGPGGTVLLWRVVRACLLLQSHSQRNTAMHKNPHHIIVQL